MYIKTDLTETKVILRYLNVTVKVFMLISSLVIFLLIPYIANGLSSRGANFHKFHEWLHES